MTRNIQQPLTLLRRLLLLLSLLRVLLLFHSLLLVPFEHRHFFTSGCNGNTCEVRSVFCAAPFVIFSSSGPALTAWPLICAKWEISICRQGKAVTFGSCHFRPQHNFSFGSATVRSSLKKATLLIARDESVIDWEFAFDSDAFRVSEFVLLLGDWPWEREVP